MYDVEPSLLAAILFRERAGSTTAFAVRLTLSVSCRLCRRPPPIELSPVEEVDVNAHAEVRYFFYVRDNLFNDLGLSPGSGINLTLRSCNVGRTLIQWLRREAECEDLDPNLWFGDAAFSVGSAWSPSNTSAIRDGSTLYTSCSWRRTPSGRMHARRWRS